RIDTKTERAVVIPVGLRPYNIAVGEGAAWVVTIQSRSGFSLERIDLESNKVTSHGVVPSAYLFANVWDLLPGVTVADGSVWVSIGDSNPIEFDPKQATP